MKYAKLGQRKAIQRIIDTELQPNADVTAGIELTDEQVVEVEAIRADRKIPLWFDGRVTTREAESVGHRFRWDDEAGDFIKTTIVPPVPESLANWRVKAVLDMQGLTATVDTAIAALPDSPEKIVISRAWNGNGDVFRNSPTVTSFMSILSLTDAQVDDMFRLAATFNP
jgi:hypothetical protein